MSRNLKTLISKLNDPCRKALEGAAGLCLSQTHYEVDIEHLLIKLLEQENLDLHAILRHFEVDASRLQRDLTESLKNLKSGNTRTPTLSARIPGLIEQAWLTASIDHGADQVQSGHLLVVLLTDPDFARLLRDDTRTLREVSVETLTKELDDITQGSSEAMARAGAEADDQDVSGAAAVKATPALDQYTVNLAERVRAGRIDPVLGRDHEVRQMVDILTRRRQNNPILTGEAGVGKTAVVEGLAQRIAEGDVPPALTNVVLRTLDLGLLQAGASVKGEFENRLKSVIDEVKASPQPIILFIDEAHTLIGAGGQAGQGDAANLLKPALARGELRTIAATTWSEYKKYFERDAALARRFQVVKVEEPDEAKATIMLRGLADKMESHHKVRVLDEAVIEAVKLSQRYLSGRQLPDKAVSVLDTACARVAMSQNAIPAPIEDLRRGIEALTGERAALTREATAGGDHAERLAEVDAATSAAETELAELDARWQRELELVERARDLRARVEAAGEGDGQDEDLDALKTEMAQVTAELAQVQGERPLIHVCCDGQAVAEVISGWTGIPVGRMVKDEIGTVMRLRDMMEERVIGQSHALNAIAQRIQTARAGLEDPGKPIGVFLLVGTSGVGKTETALAIADILYGGERNLITINMSEFQEAHTVATLKGSPPGYIGYGEGGVLTEAVRRKPYSVVLLDEIEKAHPDVLELFFQVFDKGVLDDAEGREIDFKNTVILLTSNVGTDTIMRHGMGADGPPDSQALLEALRPELHAAFKPAFLGRTLVIPYYPLKDDVLKGIIELKLGRIRRRVRDSHRADLAYDAAVVEAILARCTEVESGARNVDSILTGTLLPDVASQVLTRMAEGGSLSRIEIAIGDDGAFSYAVT